MISLDYIEIEGFTLFKELQKVDFSKFEPNSIIGVFGENNDGSGGYDSNGSGKSNFLNSIGWCLFDRIPVQSNKETAISKSDIVHHDCKKAVVRIGLRTKDDYIEFQNERTKTGNKKVQLWINGKEFISNTDTQKRNKLFSLLGIGGKSKGYYSDFLNNCHFTGEIEKSFASENFSDVKRLEIVSRFKKLEIWDICVDLSKKDKDKTNESLKELTIKLNSLLEIGFDEGLTEGWKKNEIKNLTQVIDDLKIKYNNILNFLENSRQLIEIQGLYNQYQSNKNLVEKEIDNQIDLLEKIYNEWVSLKSELKEYKEKLFEISESLAEHKTLEAYKTDKKTLEDSYNKLVENESNDKSNLSIKEKELTSLENEDYYVCPECKSNLILKNDHLHKSDIDIVNKTIKELKESIKTLKLKIEKTDGLKINKKVKIQKVEDLIDSRKELDSDELSNKNQLNRVKTKLENEDFEELKNYLNKDDNLKEEIFSYENYEDWISINELVKTSKEKYDKLKKGIGDELHTDDELPNVQKLISSNEEKIREVERRFQENQDLLIKTQSIQETIKEREKEIETYDKWLIYFRQLKTIELLETKPILEQFTNDILSKLGTNIKVEYLLNIESNSLSLKLEEDSGEIIPLELFSKGQSNRISFAAGLALRHLTDSEQSFDLGFSIWDEVLDGLDHTGQSLFFDVLHDTSGLKLCISHDANLQNYFSNKILITRQDHSSTIKII